MELPPPSPQDARPPARPRSLSDSSEHLLHFERVKRVKLEAAQLVSESCRLSSSSWKSDMCTARSVRQRIAHNRRRVSPIGLGSTATAPGALFLAAAMPAGQRGMTGMCPTRMRVKDTRRQPVICAAPRVSIRCILSTRSPPRAMPRTPEKSGADDEVAEEVHFTAMSLSDELLSHPVATGS